VLRAARVAGLSPADHAKQDARRSFGEEGLNEARRHLKAARRRPGFMSAFQFENVPKALKYI